jgi:hypothetical protein
MFISDKDKFDIRNDIQKNKFIIKERQYQSVNVNYYNY